MAKQIVKEFIGNLLQRGAGGGGRARLVAAALVAAACVALAGCNTLQSVEISGEPGRTVYGQGQAFDLAELGATEYYKKEGDVRAVSAGSLQVSGYDKDKPGEQTVTVSYTKKKVTNSATFKVTVIPVASIAIEQPPATTSYKQGDEFNPAGLQVKVEYEGGAVPAETIGPERLSLSGYTKDSGGRLPITVDYYGKRATFEVRVAALVGISVASMPDKTEYWTGEELDLAGLVVLGNYEELGEEPVSVTLENLSSYDKNRNGQQDVVVTYLGKTTKFPVTYVALSAIKVDTPPAKLEYENGENLDIAGLVVMGTRQGAASMEMLDTSRLKVSGYDRFKAGSQTVTITVGGKSATFKVTVGPIPFVGTWRGTWNKTLTGGNAESGAVTLTMTETTWSLTATVTQTVPATGKAETKEFSFSGTYARDTDTGKSAKLQAETAYWDGNATSSADAPKNAEILPSGALKLTGGRNYGQGLEITLTR